MLTKEGQRMVNNTETICYMFNKPQGCITARRDPRHKTVMEYFPSEMRDTFNPVGRLDKNTEGFLVITNDGMLTKKLCDPQEGTKKQYFLWAIGEMTDEKMQRIKRGISIKHREEPCLEAEIKVEKKDFLYNIRDFFSKEHSEKLMKNKNLPVFSCYITIAEGKKHQVKRMMKAIGCTVVYLKRVKIGNLCLDKGLKSGMYRKMTFDEIKKLEG